MSKVTSKLQVSIPKAVARRYNIRPGSHVFFEPAGDVIRLRPERDDGAQPTQSVDLAVRLRMFDAASERQRERNRKLVSGNAETTSARGEARGWTREELYERGLPR